MDLVDAARGRVWRAYADARRVVRRAGSARPALGLFDVGPGDDDWLRASADGFDRYRSAHPPAAATAAVVCATLRPDRLTSVVANVARQRDVDLELVVVTNSDGFDDAALDTVRRSLDRCTVVAMPPEATLGECLNAGMAATEERFVAKMDDDDLYGDHYLVDALRAHGYAGAAVVGKHTYYADLVPPGHRYLRFPGNEFRYSGTLAGGTLLIDRERTGDLQFDAISIGEDRAFLRSCHRRGLSTFAADRFGFVQHRGTDNTWVVPPEDFVTLSVRVDPVAPEHRLDTPSA